MIAAVLDRQGTQKLRIATGLRGRAPRRREVEVAIMAAGLCHSDLAAMSGSLYIPTPAVMGHEAAGIVTRVGPEARGFSAGDRVIIGVSIPCGSCDVCVHRHSPHLCEEIFFDVAAQTHFEDDLTEYQAMGAVGAFAETVVARVESLVRMPDDLPFAEAALLSCGATCGYGAVANTCNVQSGQDVAVFGLGCVGLAAIQAAQVRGARRIWAIDPVAERRSLALDLGATAALTPGDLDRFSQDAAAFEKFDFAIEASGSDSALKSAWNVIRRGGTACAVGMGGDGAHLRVETRDLYFTEKHLVASYHGSSNFQVDVPLIIDLWRRGAFKLSELITSRLPLHDINRAVNDLRAGRGIRTILEPSTDGIGLDASKI